ncbi:MAG: DUF2735 domain-containing protein, partial [Bradyrhizobium sp.]
MTKQQQQGTATIFQFPARPRATSDSRRQTVKPTRQLATAEFGRGWYHDDAIEAEAACKP